MSEAQKPVEEPVASTSTEAPAAVEPTTTTTTEAKTETPAAEPTTETAAPATSEPATETAAAETPAKEEVKPVEAGVLGYKGPGLLKSFIFQKKYFWFQTEPLEQKHLTFYLRGEKPEVGDKNGAWAIASGKGLLLFSKKEADKQFPGGIIPLSEAKDLTEDGTVDFHFTVDGHKHTFQASTLAERDNWVAVLKTKIAEAVELAPTVKESETYKSTLKQYVETRKGHLESRAKQEHNPNTAAKEEKKEDKAEAKEEKKEEKAEAKEEKKEEKTARKSRSASRKRTSIFGSIFPKKEEEKKEEAAAPAEATPAVEPASETPAETTAPTEPATEAPAATEPVAETKAEEKPKAAKRASIFGNLSFNKKEKKSEEAPVVPAKDEPATTEPVAETAPVIPAVESTEPLGTTAATAETPAETAPTTNGVEPETAPANKRKSTLPFGFGTKKEKAATSDEETEKPKSPFAKLRATVRGKKAEKDPEKTPEVPAVAETKAEEIPSASATTEPEVVSEPTPAAHTSTPQVSATA